MPALVPAERAGVRSACDRWVLEHVQDGKESDGRRVLTGGSGSRQAAFRYMLRLLGIPSELALVKNRLATPPLGKMSEVSRSGRTVLFVSHNMATVLNLCESVALFERGRLAFRGGCAEGVRRYTGGCTASTARPTLLEFSPPASRTGRRSGGTTRQSKGLPVPPRAPG